MCTKFVLNENYKIIKGLNCEQYSCLFGAQWKTLNPSSNRSCAAPYRAPESPYGTHRFLPAIGDVLMGRANSKIRARELRSLLRAVADAGVKVTRIEVNTNGGIAMLTSNAENATGEAADVLDKELAEFEGRTNG